MMPDAKIRKLVAGQSFTGYEFSAYMGGKGMDKSLVNKARRILASVLIAALCVCNMAMPAFAEEAVAASFRLYQTEGTVTVQNQNGKEMTAMQDMKLFNGYQISTEQKSYAWFEADSTKLFKMDAVSNLEVRKKGKQSELLLNSGNLFFNVTEHLQDDEVLNIRTSSLVVGIRGTSGWVKVIDQYHTILYMLDGSVEASVTDPVSGQRKSITLRGGQRAEFWIYDKNKEGDKCDIIVRQYGEEEIDGFVAVELKKNQQLQERIRGGGGSGAGGSAGGGTGAGFDLVSTLAKAEERLKQDQEEVARKLEEIKKQLAGLAHKVDVDPVFTNNTSKSEDSGSSGGASGGSATETVADPTTLTMPVDDITVHDYLNNKKVSVILQPSANANENNFAVANGLTVPSGKSLTIQNGISTSVESGKTLQVDGHMETAGNLANAGTVNSTSMNTLQIGGDFTNSGTVNNTTGRVIIKGTLSNNGTVNNSSVVVITGGTGSESGAANAITLTGGTLNWQSGTATAVVVDGGTLNATGGTLESVDVQSGSFTLDGGTLSNGLNQTSTSATVNLVSGTIQGNENPALQVSGIVNWNPNDATGNVVVVTASKPGNLVKIFDRGSIRYHDNDTNVDVSLESGALISCGTAGAPYTVKHIYSTARETLEIQDEDYLIVSGNSENSVNDGKSIWISANKSIDLAGFRWKMPMVQIGEDNGNTQVEVTVIDSEDDGKLIIPQEIQIGTTGTLNLKTDCERIAESLIVVNGSLYLQGESDDRIVISQSGMDQGIERSLIQGGRGKNNAGVGIDCIDYNNMSAPFLDTSGLAGMTINHCSLTATENIMGAIIRFDGGDVFFRIQNLDEGEIIEDVEIISASKEYGPLMGCWGDVTTDGSRLIQKSAEDNNAGVVIKGKAGFLAGSRENKEYPGDYDYWAWGTDSEGYCYLKKINQAPQSILPSEILKPVVDEIVDSSLLATKNDADIIDEDFGYEEEEDEENLKATPNNATWSNDEIVDEDEPYQDEDDESEDEENWNIPVEPAIPSTSTKDTTQPEEDPDSKKDENPDTNNPEQEENQNGDPDSNPEEEPEPEKEQVDLLHTEPSNVPDQREEEES